MCKGSGYYGRLPIAEMLMMDEGVRALFRDHLPLQQIRLHMRNRGFLSLWDQAQDLLQKGLTTTEEIFITLGETPHVS